jgi:hypothetical protein
VARGFSPFRRSRQLPRPAIFIVAQQVRYFKLASGHRSHKENPHHGAVSSRCPYGARPDSRSRCQRAKRKLQYGHLRRRGLSAAHLKTPGRVASGNRAIGAGMFVRALAGLLVILMAGCAGPVAIAPQPSPSTASRDSPKASPSLPSGYPPSDCLHTPEAGFLKVWSNAQVRPRLGCALAPSEYASGSEVYFCDGTHSLWLSEQGVFVVLPIWPHLWTLVEDHSGVPADEPLMPVPESSPEPCFVPSGRHGWVADSLAGERNTDLLARTEETTFDGATQYFEGGWLLWNGDVCFVLFADHTWTMF